MCSRDSPIPVGVNATIRRRNRTLPACSQPGVTAGGPSDTLCTIRWSLTALLRPGLPGNAIQAAAAPEPAEPVYRKNVNSAFIGTTLESDLRQDGIDTLVIVGLTTNHCVSTTVRMAGNLGFTTFVVSDATAAFARSALDGSLRPAATVHSAALSDLHGEFATVVDTAEVLQGVGS